MNYYFTLIKERTRKQNLLKNFHLLFVGVTLLLSVYDSLTSPVPNRSFIDILFLSVSSIAGLINIIFAIMLNKIKIEKRKVTFTGLFWEYRD